MVLSATGVVGVTVRNPSHLARGRTQCAVIEHKRRFATVRTPIHLGRGRKLQVLLTVLNSALG